MTAALEGLRVLDLTEPEGHLCGRLLADLGAEVIKIEPPRGDAARHMGPFKGDSPDPEASLPFCYLNTNKKSVVIDPSTTKGRDELKALFLTSDAIIETFPPGTLEEWNLDYPTLQKDNPGLVMASITGFGLSGPYSQFKAPSIVCAAMGGVMYLCGSPDKPPLAEPNDQPYHLASAFAALGVLLALRHRDATGLGQRVEVSCQEVQAAEQHVIVNYSANANVLKRAGSRTPIGGGMPYGVYPAKDGFCHLVVISTAHWRSFVEWMGSPDALTDPIWDNRHTRIANGDLIEHLTTQFTRELPKADLFSQGQARHVTAAPINRPDEFVQDPHTLDRETFQIVHHPAIGECKLVRSPFRLSATPAKVLRPAPALGQHTREILDGVGETLPRRQAGRPSNSSLPLSGIRVLDFSQAIAGPVLTQHLASFGAEVIKIESQAHQQRGRVSEGMDPRILLQQRVTFADINRNKRSITVNLSTEEGRRLIRRLVPHCDVVVENFSPRVMDRWNLGYEELRKLRQDIIMARLPGFGLSGPYRDYVGLAAVAMGITGMYHQWSYADDSEPAGPPVWVPDYLSAAFGGVALMAALRHRDRTGEGQLIELSQVDATAFGMGTTYLDYFVNGRVATPTGNSHPHHAPHGAYRCRSEDEWCVIAVRNQEEWRALSQTIGSPDWTGDSRFSTVEGRLAHRDELDQRVEEWTRYYSPHQVMDALQRAGVPAGIVQDGGILFRDRHLRERGFITTVDHPDTGPIEYPGPPVRLWETPGRLDWWHNMGQDNAYVFGTLLDMSPEEISTLQGSGVLS